MIRFPLEWVFSDAHNWLTMGLQEKHRISIQFPLESGYNFSKASQTRSE